MIDSDEMLEIDYAILEAEVGKALAADGVCVLATSFRERVTARSISIICEGLSIWFQASLNSTKLQQVKQNAHVAICRANLQYEGLAEIRGNARDNENDWFLREYPRAHPGSFKNYGDLADERVVRVRPLRAVLWKYINGRPCRDILEVDSKRAWREWQPVCDDSGSH